jgi:hypothetical protein
MSNSSSDLDIHPGGYGEDRAAFNMAAALLEGGKDGQRLGEIDRGREAHHKEGRLLAR